MTVKIYDSVLEQIQNEIDNSKFPKIENEESRHYYFEGLKVAKQIVESIQDNDYSDYAYEKFEEIVESYLDLEVNQSLSLYPEDILEVTKSLVDEMYED
jgi:sulfate adenylyltransferase subunit 1 (EFTu-like GTPase family)